MTFIAYMDESQDPKKEKVQTIAGLLASEAEWKEISAAWELLLDKHGLCEFHAVDCVGGNEDFRKYKGNPDKRELIYNEFLALLLRPGQKLATAVSIMLRPYKQHLPGLATRRKFPPKSATSGPLDDPYFMAFEHVVQEIATDKNIAELDEQERIGFVFDENRTFEGRAQPFFRDLRTRAEYRSRLGAIAFDDSYSVLPLQTADIVAYEYRRHVEEVLIGGGSPRQQYIALARKYGGGWKIDDEHLSQIVAVNDGTDNLTPLPAEMFKWPD
jgi:hypothetical protein